MSTCTHGTMTNHHALTGFAAVADTFHVWRERLQQRRELSHWNKRDALDAGQSWSEIVAESEKPFWRA